MAAQAGQGPGRPKTCCPDKIAISRAAIVIIASEPENAIPPRGLIQLGRWNRIDVLGDNGVTWTEAA